MKYIQSIIENPDEVGKLNENQISTYLFQILDLLNELNEPSLIELDGRDEVIFVGDTHGDFETTKTIVQQKFLPNPNNKNLVFLGDYINRTPPDVKYGSIKNITFLFLLKLSFPNQIYLLKGNHESIGTMPCHPYEFEVDLKRRFGTKTRLHPIFLKLFAKLPLMIKTKNGIYAAHGGILKNADLNELRNVDKNDKHVLSAIVWSDPIDYGPRRGGIPRGDSFSSSELSIFLKNIGAKVMIRGHDYNTLGYSIYNNKCLTIFSSRSYVNKGNGGVLIAKSKLNKKISNVLDLEVEDVSSGMWKMYRVGVR
jgi:predicted phosphodiesterase